MTPDPTTIDPPSRERLPGRTPLRIAQRSEPVEHTRFEGEERFAAYIAHELRTPLATQRALLELTLTDPLADRACWRGVARELLEACLQQERLLEACLTLARSRCEPPRHQPVDLGAIADEALRTHDPHGTQRVLVPGPAWTTGDPSLLARLAANLVSNAIRHNIAGGRVEVATRTVSGRAVLTIANTGPLIPVGELERLFQPFHRLNSNAQSFSDGVGLGLGLAIVQAIAEAHNAIVIARPRAGGGLEIDVSFAATPEQSDRTP
ncbi:MAG: sensor histidine kinase [Nitrososphaerales archaeon]